MGRRFHPVPSLRSIASDHVAWSEVQIFCPCRRLGTATHPLILHEFFYAENLVREGDRLKKIAGGKM
jgi:hypothetical protein